MKNWMLSIKAALVCFAIVMAPGCGQQGQGLPKFEGIEGPIFNIVDGKIIVEIKFLNLNINGGAGMVIPELKESTLSLAPNALDGGMLLSLVLHTTDLEGMDIGIGEGNVLPDGRLIPGIPGGELQNSVRFDTNIEGYDVSFYLNKQLFGLWMPFGFETAQLSAYYNVIIKNRNFGLLSLVGNQVQGDLKAGGLLFLRLSALKDPGVKRLLKLSKQNPHLKY